MTNSAFAGTCMSMVLHLTRGMDEPLRKPAKRSSVMPGGSGAVAE